MTRAPARGRLAGRGADLRPRRQRPGREGCTLLQHSSLLASTGCLRRVHVPLDLAGNHHAGRILRTRASTLRRARRRLQRRGPARRQLLRLLVLRERDGGEATRAPRSALRPVGRLGQPNVLQYHAMLDQRQEIRRREERSRLQVHQLPGGAYEESKSRCQWKTTYGQTRV